MSETLTHKPEQNKQETREFQKKPGIPFVDKLKKKHPYESMMKGAENIPNFMAFVWDLIPFKERSTEEIEKQKQLVESVLARTDVPPKLRAEAGTQRHMLEKELLYRNNPEYKELQDKARELHNERVKKASEWNQQLIEKEGYTEFLKKLSSHQLPDFEIPEELQLNIDIAKMEEKAGLSSEVKWKEEIQEAGGFNKWEREDTRKNLLRIRAEDEAKGNDPLAKKFVRNIDKILEEKGYTDEIKNRK